ncbi:MAG: AAA family ATPase [Deltaproteobacteria bacterium]|nr:AAA family ATPase [Deltaproteobacteria bacterium]
MKKGFVQTKSVQKFISTMGSLNGRGDGVPGMALVFGEPGLGKTRTALWYTNQDGHMGSGAVFLRTKKLMTGRWLLEELVAELGEAPAWKTADLFRQAVDQLMGRPRLVMIDEVDYLAYDARVIETLRDLHDITGAPFVFIGMDRADQKLRRYRHLYDRFSEILKFKPLDKDDVKKVAAEMTDIQFDAGAIDWLTERTQGMIRQLIIALHRAERVARARGLKQITAGDLAGK